MSLADLIRLAERAPDAVRFVLEADEAFNDGRKLAGIKGGAAGLGLYVKNGGWEKGLRAVSPELHGATEAALPAGRKAIRDFQDHLAGRNRPLPEPAYAQFKRWWIKQPSGPSIVVGRTGSGKTELMKSLAAGSALHFDRPIECLNWYPQDLPPSQLNTGEALDVRIIDLDVLTNRMERLRRAMRANVQRDAGDPGPQPKKKKSQQITSLVPVDDAPAEPEIITPDIQEAIEALPFRNRVIAIDESGLEDLAGNQKARQAVVRALTQSRHLDWTVIYCGQTFSQFPKDLIGQSVLFIRAPTGRERDTDRQLTYVRYIWRQAFEEFKDVRSMAEWSEYADVRAWSYVLAPQWKGLSEGYEGLCPNSMVA